MRLTHARRPIGVRFDDPNLSCAGLAPNERWRWPSVAGYQRWSPTACGSRPRVGRTPARWSPGWSPAQTRSARWTCCATAGWFDCVQPNACAIDVGHVPAVVHLRSCSPAPRRGCPVAGPPGPRDPDPVERRERGVGRPGCDGAPKLRLCQTRAAGAATPASTVSMPRSPRSPGHFGADDRANEAAPGRGNSLRYGYDITAVCRRAGAHFSISAGSVPAD
jgi:hypothetical protein